MTLLERLNATDRFANGIGARITEVREGYARTEMTVAEQHINGAGTCQGGAIFTLADLAFAAVANCHGLMTVGISNTITFLHAGMLGDVLTAECIEQFDHHKLPYCDIKVTNQKGELIATMTGLAYRTKREMEFETLM